MASYPRVPRPNPRRLLAPAVPGAILVVGLLALVVLPIGTPWLGGSATPAPHHAGASPSAVPPASGHPAYSYPTPIRHVFTLFLENAELSKIRTQGPFEMHLAQKYAFASNFYAECHPSASNYLAATSGKTWQCGSDNYNVYNAENIGDLAQKAGLSWKGYAESMPTSCGTTNTAAYAVKHNPLVYYQDIVGNSTLCKAHDVSFAGWNSDVQNGTLPAYAFIAPNRTHDGHDTNVSFADNWLKGWLSPYLNASWFNSTVWFITYDEGGTSTGYNGLVGGHTYFTAVSPWVKLNSTFTNDSSHYNMLATTEWLLGLGGTGQNDSSASFPPMKGLFNFSQPPPPPTYNVTGRVTAASSGTPIGSALVSVAGGTSTRTDSLGNYSFRLENGTYSISAQATGFNDQTATVYVSGAAAVQDFALTTATGQNLTYSFSGTVTATPSGTSIVGATVAIAAGGSTLTDAQGGFAFQLRNGTYRVTVTSAGYQAQSASVTIRGAPSVHNFVLPVFTYTLNGTITEFGTGAPVGGATVGVGATPLATSSANGGYSLALANGTYTLTFAAAGYVTQDWGAVVQARSITHNVQLVSLTAHAFSFSLHVVVTPNGAPVVGEPLTFTAVANRSTGTLSFNWTFGDGGRSTEVQPAHTYVAAGVFLVNVTGRATNGTNASASLSVTVGPASSPGGGRASSASGGLAGYWAASYPFNYVLLGLVAVILGELVYLRTHRRKPRPPARGSGAP